MEYVLIRQSLFVRINRSDELSVWRIKCSQLYTALPGWNIARYCIAIAEVYKACHVRVPQTNKKYWTKKTKKKEEILQASYFPWCF